MTTNYSDWPGTPTNERTAPFADWPGTPTGERVASPRLRPGSMTDRLASLARYAYADKDRTWGGINTPWGNVGRGFSRHAFGQTAADIFSFGMDDEMFGAGLHAMTGRPYAEGRDAVTTMSRNAMASHPLSAAAGGFYGGVAVSPAVTKLASMLPGAAWLEGVAATPANRVPFSPLIARTASGIYTGGVAGALAGAGFADDGERLKGALEGAKTGAMWGGGVGGALPLLPKWAGGIAANPALRTGAGALAAAATGYALAPEGADRLGYAGAGALIGGGGAAGAPAASRIVNQVIRNAAAASHAQRGAGSLFGALEAMRAPPPPLRPTPAPRPSAGAIEELDRARGRRGLSIDELEAEVARQRRLAGELGEVGVDAPDTRLIDVLEEPGLQMGRAAAQGPGQTGQRARDVSAYRHIEAPYEMANDATRVLGVTETPTQASNAIRAARQTGKDGYAALRGTTPSRDIVARELAPLLEVGDEAQAALRAVHRDEAHVAALARAQARIAGLPDPEPPPSTVVLDPETGRYALSPDVGAGGLLNLKGALDDVLEAAADPMSMDRRGQQTLVNVLRPQRTAIMRALDRAMPQYSELRGMYGDTYLAREALKDAGEFTWNMRPEAVAQRMRMHPGNDYEDPRPTLPFERRMYQIRFVDDLIGRIMGRGSNVGEVNPANVLKSPEMNDRIRAVFQDAEDPAEAFLHLVRMRNQLMRTAQEVGGGSSTASNAAHQGEQAIGAALGDAALSTATTGHPGLGWVNAIKNILTGGHLERRNNEIGDILFRRVGPDASYRPPRDPLTPDVGPRGDEAAIDELIRRMRALGAQRAQQAQFARQSGSAGVGAGAYGEFNDAQ